MKTGDRLLRLRNPWGDTEWSGKWKGKSKRWTDSLILQADLTKKDLLEDNGIFCMEVSDFCR